MDAKQPTKILSIAVPAYNVEQYLAKGLSTYADARLESDLEVLIVDDGSTDETSHIAQRFVDKHPSLFRLISKQNGGHGSAINAGLAHATGKYFRIIDGDDWAHTDNLVALIDILRHTETDLVVDVKREVKMGTDESRLFPLPDSIPQATPLAFSEVCLRAEIESSFMIHTISARTDFLRSHQVSLLEHTFYVDYEFIVKATCFAETVEFYDLEVCQYQVGNIAQSVAPANYVKRFDDHTRVVKELLQFSTQQALPDIRRQYVNSRVDLLINTHYNIALIFDEDRKRGLARAQEFYRWLESTYPERFLSTKRRYKKALILHHLGFNAQKLDKLMGRA